MLLVGQSQRSVLLCVRTHFHTASKHSLFLFNMQLLESEGALAALCGALRLPPQVTRASAAAEPLAAPVRRQSSTVRSLCLCAPDNLFAGTSAVLITSSAHGQQLAAGKRHN